MSKVYSTEFYEASCIIVRAQPIYIKIDEVAKIYKVMQGRTEDNWIEYEAPCTLTLCNHPGERIMIEEVGRNVTYTIDSWQ